jgi:hypothetical protein
MIKFLEGVKTVLGDQFKLAQKYFDDRMTEFGRKHKLRIITGMGTMTAEMYVTLEDGTLQEVPIHNMLSDTHFAIERHKNDYDYEMEEEHIRERLSKFDGDMVNSGYSKIPEEQIQRVLAAQKDLQVLNHEAMDFAQEVRHPWEYMKENAEEGNYSSVQEGDYTTW